MFPTDTVRLYGYLDPQVDAVPAQVDLAELKDCKDKTLHYFLRKTGEPSENLLMCATKMASGDVKKAYTFLAMQVNRLATDHHGKARADECKAVDKTDKALVVRLEMLMRSAYLQALAHMTQKVMV